jgi:hypothetical protein
MATLAEFAEWAAIISAMADVYTVGRATFTDFLNRRRAAPNYVARGQLLQAALSTYSDDEIEAIKKRIESCRDRFIAEGSGAQRKVCLCSVLSDVRDGNGGTIPMPDLHDIYNTLGCANMALS